MKIEDLPPGTIGFGPIHGAAGNLLVGPAQLLLAVAEPGMVWNLGPGEWYEKRHVLVCTGDAHAVQAMPGGAEEIVMGNEHCTDEWTFVLPAYDFPLDQGGRTAWAAESFVGTPYDFKTYGAIPLWRRGIRTKRLKDIISGTDTMMCSRLADAALATAGYHAFDDGRLPGDVTPSELYRALLRKQHTILSVR